jgi:predicted nuclease of predicted toxin-antitoxin system
MKLLLDSCVSAKAANDLRVIGHDVDWVGERDADPGDDAILAEAFQAGRILITLDKDFGELAIVFGRKHSGIVRIANFRSGQQAAIIDHVVQIHGAELEQGAVVTAEPGRIRIRPPENDSE